MKSLENLNFDNTYSQLPEVFGTKLLPTPLPEPYLVSFNLEGAELIDLDPKEVNRPEFVTFFSGNRLLPGSQPLAMLYSGHQFGVYVPQLGDGRAILLGEVVNHNGERWDLHLKGAGKTPYSRHGDGRAVLRSTIREYLCSEAMHGLRIPTTRSLCIIGSDDKVMREMVETSAVLLRLAPSHIRFGSFEVFYYCEEFEPLQTLAEYVIEFHFPFLKGKEDRYIGLFAEIVKRTAKLIAHWQSVGFAHGVMNTDNMSVLGLTFDYGPFGFMDSYDPTFICNHSDHTGRYAFHQQPRIGFWNLTRLAKALSPLFPMGEAQEVLESYQSLLIAQFHTDMRKKLGLNETQKDDEALIGEFLHLMHQDGVDYTICFRAMGHFQRDSKTNHSKVRDLFVDREAFDHWAQKYRNRLKLENTQDSERKTQMDGVNPKYVLRNYLAQVAILKAVEERDFSEIDRLLFLLKSPFHEHPEMEHYADLPPDWARHIQVGCSS
ncbi:MAG TPA: YdiU family protein [Nitrospiria bacterium]|jgi:hypothetical protein